MRDLSSCSGPWGGFWIQGKVRGQMSIRLTIQENAMRGRGSDVSGPFAMHGQYDPETHQVTIEKIYPWLLVVYHGTWNGSFIAGNWQIPGDDAGVFEMWPLDEEVSFEGLVEQLALPENLAPALPAPSS